MKLSEVTKILTKLSTNSNCTIKMGCFLYDKKAKTFVAEGFNYHPFYSGDVNFLNKETVEYKQQLPRPTHAEVATIFDYLRKYKKLPSEDIELYVSSMPCAGCADFIKQTNIKTIYYINDFDNNYGELILKSAGVNIKKLV